MSSASALDHLRELPRFGDGPGLHRMAALREVLAGGEGSAETSPAIRITGSNGKGTVAHLVAALLRELGLSVGLYTSPHFLRFEERFQIDGEPLPRTELEDAASRVREAIDGYLESHPDDRVSGFEALTAMAWDLFRRRGLDVIVAEAGIGGRFDSTRVFPGAVTALTSLELEHTAVLGRELLDIAYDKADLCPDGGVLVTGELDGEIGRRVAGALALRGARRQPVREVLSWEVREVRPDGMRIELETRDGAFAVPDLELALVGRHQALNAALAVQLVREWLARNPAGGDLDPRLPDAIRRAFALVRVPGRFQRLEAAPLWQRLVADTGPEVWVDVAHTPVSAAALAATVGEALAGRPVVLVAGASRGRDPEMLAPVLGQAAGVVCAVSRYRGESSEILGSVARRHAPGRPRVIAGSVEEGLIEARALAARLGPDPVLLVTGSYFLAAEAASVAAGGDPERLGFAESA